MKSNVIFAAALSASLLLGQAVPAGAVTIDELTQQRNATSANLTQVQKEIDTLETQKKDILGEIDSLDANLVTTITAIDTLDSKIEAKEKEITATSVDLDRAIQKQETSYNAMKKRIQYIYESGGDAGWAYMLFSADNLTNMLNKGEFTQNMYKYDRDCLEEYAAIVQDVQDLKEKQSNEKLEYETIKSEQESEKTHLEDLLSDARATSANYDEEIAKAYDAASSYQTLLANQNQAIAVLVEMQRQAEAAAAAEEAARQEAAAAAQEAQVASYDDDDSYDNASYSDEDYYDDGGDADTSDSGSSGSGSSGSGSSGSGSSGRTYSGSGTGQDLVNYAMQYVGNPYVYGGNSLTDGIDCSGFVNQVYSHFGYDVARQSGELRNEGTEVSYSDAQPGDIVCYSGHVGIYMGDGQIVHASDPTRGIISGTDASYDTILSVRRVAN